jgi:TP901 family phage tail tape measure protein
VSEKIILEWVGDPSGLKPVADALKSIGALSKDQQKKFEQANNAFKKRSADIKKQTSEQQKLNKETGKGAKSVQDLANRTKQLPKNIKQAGVAAQGLGRSMMNLGRQIAAAFGVVTLVASLVMGFKQLISVNADFEAQMARVKAITGATGAEFQKLEKDAKRLGSSTKFTATQVGELQEAYAKLGFTTEEILSATEATLLLAEATGSDLGQAADTAGAVLRAFGMDASETQRVVDVMAKSFTSSALGMENFSEAMKFVAPVAKAANIDIETTTALLGKLADANLRGSIAGTGLKNLLSKLSDENSTLAKEIGFGVKNSEDLIKAFKILQKGHIDLTKATELTDERSKAAFLTLIAGIDGVEDLKIALDGAAGSAEQMAEIMRDTFKGDVDKAASAWEGLLLAMEGTDTARGFVQGLTDVIAGLTITIQKLKGEYREIMAEQGLDAAFKAGTDRAAQFKKTMEGSITDQTKLIRLLEREIERASGTYDEMNDEAAKWGAIHERYKKEIDDYSWFQVVPESTERAAEAARKNSEAVDENQESLLAYMDALAGYVELIKKGGGANDETEKYTRSIKQLQKELKAFKTTFSEAEIGSAEWIKAIGDMELKTRELTKAQEDATKALKAFKIENDMIPPNAMDATREEMERLFQMDEENRQESLKRGADAINKQADLDKISVNERIEREEGRAVKMFDIETNRIDAMIALYEAHGEDATGLRLRQSERFADLNSKELKEYQDFIDELDAMDEERDENRKQAFKDAVQASGDIATELFGRITEIQNNALDFEMQNLDARLEAGEITREEYEQKRQAAQQKQAANNKQNALFEAIINTAVAVTKALTDGDYANAILFGVLGGAEIAAIASQPIPQFAVGTKDAPAGFKWVGEKGAELVYDGGGYPIITHAESKALSEDPHSAQAQKIRQKYDIPNLDVGLFGNNLSYSDKVKSAQGSRNSIDYDKLGKVLAENLMGKNRDLLRSLEKSRDLDRAGYTALIDALGNTKQKRRGYAT